MVQTRIVKKLNVKFGYTTTSTCERIYIDEFEDTKGAFRTRTSKKNRQHNGQIKKSTKGQTTIYKTNI